MVLEIADDGRLPDCAAGSCPVNLLTAEEALFFIFSKVCILPSRTSVAAWPMVVLLLMLPVNMPRIKTNAAMISKK